MSALNIYNRLLLRYVRRTPRFHTTFYTTFFFGVPYPLGSLSDQSQLRSRVTSYRERSEARLIRDRTRTVTFALTMPHASRTTAHCSEARAPNFVSQIAVTAGRTGWISGAVAQAGACSHRTRLVAGVCTDALQQSLFF